MNEMLLLLLHSNESKVSSMSGDPHLDAHSCVLDRAQGVQVNPSAQYPSFLKQLLKSHLSGKFYLGLPKKFCDAHLPGHDDNVVLVDEDDREYSARYSVRKNRLSGGWRGFSSAHELLEGDTLVFHLIENCRFKVYIVRAVKVAKNDGDISLQTSELNNSLPFGDVKAEQKPGCGGACASGKAKRYHPNCLAVDTHQETRRTRGMPDIKPSNFLPGNVTDEVSSSTLQSVRGSTPETKLKDFEAFSIKVDGLIIDSEMPIHVRRRYYYLCCSRRMLLHDHLIKGLSSNLAVAMITETVNIADAIRSSNLTISLHHLECWEKTLKAFEDLGMAVGFLCSRLHKLISVLHAYLSSVETRRAKLAQADKEISNLETTSWTMRSLAQNLEAEVKSLMLKKEMLGSEYQRLAGAPW